MAEIRNRGNGSWQVTLYDGYTPDGKHRRISRTIKVDPKKTEGAQRKLVEKEAAKIQADYDRHILTDSKKIKLSELADDYLESKNISITTRQGYRVLLDGRILPRLGNCYVQDLTVRDLQKFFNDLKNEKPFSNRAKEDKLGGNTQHHYFTLLRALLNYAVKTQVITISPMNGIDAPKKEVSETEILELEDCAALLEALDKMPDPMWKCYFYMALYTCCRPGELTALNWEDISENTVSIAHGTAYTKEDGTFRTDQPKNSKSIRKIILPPEAMKVLAEWRKAQLALRLQFGSCWPEGNAVFTGPEGREPDGMGQTDEQYPEPRGRDRDARTRVLLRRC